MSLQASSSSSKKRKHPEQSVDVAESISKKSKKEGKDRLKKRDKKGKARQAASDAVEREFKVISASVTLSLPPRFAMSPMSGVNEMLDSLIMRYVPALRGVMLSHSNARFLSQTAKIINECPFAICEVGFDATVWSPQVGTKLTGKINLCSPDHVSLLIHQTFNVSIPRHHIPTDYWEFEYGPAENDPEFGPLAIHAEEKTDIQTDTMEIDMLAGIPGVDAAANVEEAAGIWIHKTAGDRLGGKEGFLEFTVIGLKVANQMLSLVGSIQSDPFSPEHVPQPAVSAKAKPIEESDIEEAEEEGALAEANERFDDEFSDDEDPFAALGKAREEAVEEEQVRKDKESSKSKEEKKRKKKEKKHKRDENDAANGVTEGSPEKPPKKKLKSKAE